MTREEAIESLRGILTEAVEFENSVCYVTEEDREPLEMAIKALEQQTCDVFDEYGNYKYPSDVKLTEPNTATSMPCEDAISREDALMALTGEWTEITDEIIHRFIKRIKALPPVNPQPKTGHWEWVQYDYNPKIGNWHCSECRSVVVECVSKEEKGGIPLYKYCPQCGTKMSEIPTGSDPQESEKVN